MWEPLRSRYRLPSGLSIPAAKCSGGLYYASNFKIDTLGKAKESNIGIKHITFYSILPLKYSATQKIAYENINEKNIDTNNDTKVCHEKNISAANSFDHLHPFGQIILDKCQGNIVPNLRYKTQAMYIGITMNIILTQLL